MTESISPEAAPRQPGPSEQAGKSESAEQPKRYENIEDFQLSSGDTVVDKRGRTGEVGEIRPDEKADGGGYVLFRTIKNADGSVSEENRQISFARMLNLQNTIDRVDRPESAKSLEGKSSEELADIYRKQQFQERAKQYAKERLSSEVVQGADGRRGVRLPSKARPKIEKDQTAPKEESVEVSNPANANEGLLEDVLQTIQTFADQLRENDTPDDLRGARQISGMVDRANLPGAEGVKGLQQLREYVSGTIQTKMEALVNLNDPKRIQEYQAEIKKRQGMLDTINRELGERSITESTEGTKVNGSEAANEEPTQKVESDQEVSKKPDEPQEKPLPTDGRELIRYFKDNFGQLEGAPLENFRKAFTSQVEHQYKAWVEQHVTTLIKDKPVGTQYPDTIASVLGNDPSLAQRIIAVKDGQVVDQNVLLKMPFSQFATKYLKMKLPKGYGDNFSARPH